MKVLCAASLVLLLAGCTAPAIHERTVTLAPGGRGFAEVNLVMEKGQSVAWTWTVQDGVVFFDVHSHGSDGKVTEHVAKSGIATDTGNFTAPASGTYSLLWENEGDTPVSLHYRATGNATLDPKYPPVP